MSLRQSVASSEFVTVGPVVTGAADPTTDDVDMAFMADLGTPGEDDWVEAAWVSGGPPYFVQRMVYGDVVLTPPADSTVLGTGQYIVWLRIHDNPETPARPVDALVMFEEV